MHDARHWEYPSIDGEQIFGNSLAPGWSTTGSFQDPRQRPYGPLPRAWAHYKGLYLHGNHVIFEYTVGGTRVLEMPGFEDKAGTSTRTLNVAPLPTSVILSICHEEFSRLHVLSDRPAILDFDHRPLPSISPADVAKGLRAHWKMDEHVGAKIRAVDGAFQGELQGADWNDGKTGSALQFDGEDDRVEVSGGDELVFGSGSFTLSAWVRGETAFGDIASPDFQGGTILAKVPASGRYSAGSKSFFIQQSRLVFEAPQAARLTSKMELEPSVWHHVAVTFDRLTKECRLYVDGKVGASSHLVLPADPSGSRVRIGYTSAEASAPSVFRGRIDEVRFYNRVLSTDEIAVLLGRTIQRDQITAVACLGDTEGLIWDGTDPSSVRVKLPAGTKRRKLKFLIWRGNKKDVDLFASQASSLVPPADLEPLTRGGPPRWTGKLETHGELGSEAGAYAVDRLTWPERNPWRSWMRFGGFDFFKDDSKAALATWNGDVWIVENIDEKLRRLTWQRIAAGLFQPLGVKIVEDQIYVLGRDQITVLHDLNGDGEAGFYQNFNNDHQVSEHFHEFALDLQLGPDGHFYYNKAARHARDALFPQHGTLVKVSPDGSRTEIVANGFRAPNGLGIGPSGEMLVSDNQGHWVPANRINWIEPGGFYGNMWSYHAGDPPETYDPPLSWIPNAVDRSPGSFVWVPDERWGPLKGKLITCSYGMGRLFLVLHENTDGKRQGGVVPLPLEFDTGVMRALFRKSDGQLYVCGLYGWSGDKKYPGGFYRVRFTGKTLYLPCELRAAADGILIRFTVPLQAARALDRGSYSVSRWNYKWTPRYGSDEYRLSGEKGRDSVAVDQILLSRDRTTVFLKIRDFKPVMQMRIQMKLKAADGIWFTSDVHHTVHAKGASSGRRLIQSDRAATVREP